MKEKTELGKSITLRLTQSEYAAYQKLGGIKFMRLFLQMIAGVQKETKEAKKWQKHKKCLRHWCLLEAIQILNKLKADTSIQTHKLVGTIF